MHDEKYSATTNLPEKNAITSISQTQDFRNSWNELKERFATEIQIRHYSPCTFDGYGGHIRKFAEFCDWKDPDTITSFDAKKFLPLMATKWKCSSSSQNVALNSLLFFFRFVIKNLMKTSRTLKSKNKETGL
jgi:site-specific recombinase XerD